MVPSNPVTSLSGDGMHAPECATGRPGGSFSAPRCSLSRATDQRLRSSPVLSSRNRLLAEGFSLPRSNFPFPDRLSGITVPTLQLRCLAEFSSDPFSSVLPHLPPVCPGPGGIKIRNPSSESNPSIRSVIWISTPRPGLLDPYGSQRQSMSQPEARLLSTTQNPSLPVTGSRFN